ncbi:hypothetical protein SBOR_4678 [Sclerotinia borealis F-4128]|uniref:Uncharacterized protein n=1 Tax=Sclerotinia borealis (strain F-4128) TaxID=1432307 RepID=W9CJW6_SCLBF|nr:hypothetical protein SBOR_4678 [Sclerotinia borealis F-4128]
MTDKTFFMTVSMLAWVFGNLVGMLLAIESYSYRLAASEADMRAKILRDLLNTPAEKRSERVLDLCFFAITDYITPRIRPRFFTLATKYADFNNEELLQHLEERMAAAAKGFGMDIGIGSRSLVPLIKVEGKQLVKAMKKKCKW